MTSTERNRRDLEAAKRLARGESPSRVAARLGISRVHLWRRVGHLVSLRMAAR